MRHLPTYLPTYLGLAHALRKESPMEVSGPVCGEGASRALGCHSTAGLGLAGWSAWLGSTDPWYKTNNKMYL